MSGYIGTQPVPQATQTRQTFVATAAQTSFATGGYSVGYLDTFLNGVKLQDGVDYTATNGSDIVLTVGAALDDTLEVVAYTAFEVLDQTFTGTTTVTDSGAAPLVANRTTSDGDIHVFQKNGTTVGSIGTTNGDMFLATGVAGIRLTDSVPDIRPVLSDGSNSDATTNLGAGGDRFKDLYLSGGVYLGGTGAANKLDDYEEGTFTPTVQGGATAGTATYATQQGHYVKIGRLVHVQVYMQWTGFTGTGTHQFGGLPFTANAFYSGIAMGYSNNFTFGGSGTPMMHVQPSDTYIWIGAGVNNAGWVNTFCDASGDVIYGGTYYTDS